MVKYLESIPEVSDQSCFLFCSYMCGMTRNTSRFLFPTKRLNFCSETSLLRKFVLPTKADGLARIVLHWRRIIFVEYILLHHMLQEALTKWEKRKLQISTWFGWFCWIRCFNMERTAPWNLKLELIQIDIGKVGGLRWYQSHFLLSEGTPPHK